MLKSPLDNPALNKSYIYLPIKGTTLVRDEKNNWVLPETGEEQYKVYLKRRKKNINYLPSVGVDSEAIQLEGYLVEPMFFPEDFIIPQRLRCELSVPNGLMSGEILLDIVPANPASYLIGQQIQGTFTRKR